MKESRRALQSLTSEARSCRRPHLTWRTTRLKWPAPWSRCRSERRASSRCRRRLLRAPGRACSCRTADTAPRRPPSVRTMPSCTVACSAPATRPAPPSARAATPRTTPACPVPRPARDRYVFYIWFFLELSGKGLFDWEWLANRFFFFWPFCDKGFYFSPVYFPHVKIAGFFLRVFQKRRVKKQWF